ncbi:MAG TPA: ATP-binding protein [Oculatellaceae cyanobacterium]
MNIKLSQKAALLIVIPFAFEVLFVGILVVIQKQLETQYLLAAKSKDELTAANSELRLMLEAGSDIAMYHSTKDERFRERFRESRKKLRNEQARIIAAYSDDQNVDLAELTKQISAIAGKFDAIQGYLAEGDQLELMRSSLTANRLGQKISELATTLTEKANVADKKQRERQMRLRLAQDAVVIGGVLLSAVIASSLAVYFHRGTTKRLQILERNSQNLSENKQLEDKLDGSDEIATIDHSFHQMAELLLQARRRELALTENALDVICSFDQNGTFKRVNAAAQILWGYTADALKDTSIFDLVAPEHKNLALSQVRAKLTQQDGLVFEIPMVHKDGEEKVVQWSLQWSNEEQAFFAVLHDISERKRIERLKQEVLEMVSHDMRSPLTSLDLNLALLQTGTLGPLNDKGDTRVQQSRDILRRLISMINHLLDMEKLDSGTVEIKPSKCEVRELVNRANQSVQSMAEAKKITFDLDVQSAEIECDDQQIVSVLVNLLDNAIKFSPDESVLKIVSTPKDGLQRFLVIDRGRGIPEAQSKIIFERFKQVQTPDQPELKGSGLGLAICKSIVEAHSGTIGVCANPDGGSTFWFEIPVSQNESLG